LGIGFIRNAGIQELRRKGLAAKERKEAQRRGPELQIGK
jgi:hypothetical protein